MKKILICALILGMCASMAGCTGNQNSSVADDYDYDYDYHYGNYEDPADGVVGDNNYDNVVDEEDWEIEWKSYLDDQLEDY